MNIIQVIINYIKRINNNHKEAYMDSIEAMSIKRTHMGVGMLAITTNKVDMLFCIMVVVCVVGYVLYRHVMYMRECKRMDWSPTRTYLRTMRKEYSAYYRSDVHQ